MAAGGIVQSERYAAAFPDALIRGLSRWVPPEWRLFGAAMPHAERLVSHCGPVEIRAVPAGFIAETCVKGPSTPALKTALRRLATYVGGGNRGRVRLRTCRPVTQCPDTVDRWRTRVMLRDVTNTQIAMIARNGKVRLSSVPEELVAVVCVPGRPTAELVARGEAEIVAALLGTNWVVTGAAMVRLHSPPRTRLLGGWFEVAFPVSELRSA